MAIRTLCLNTLSLISKWAKKPLFWAITIALVFAGVMIFITVHLMHDSYQTYGFDLGVFTQDLKYTLQGKLLYSPAGEAQLAHHFSPVLLILVPVYWLFPHAQTLLVVQGLILAFSGYLIYVLAEEYKFSPRASLILEGLFFLNPLVWGVALFDFHEVVFAIPALLIMLLGIKRKQWVLFGLGLFIALISKEDVILALGIFGAILLIFDYWQHRKVEKTSVIIFCSAILAYGLAIVVSHFSSAGESPRMLSYFTNRYAYVGLPLSEGVPQALKTIFSMNSLFLLGAYLAPLAFLPLLSPKLVIPALAIMLSGILSTNTNQHTMLMQYPAPAIPFLFVAFMEVLPKIQENQQVQSFIKRTHNRAATYSTIFIVLISLTIISEGRIQLVAFPDSHDADINQVISLIPDNATVTASNTIFPHLCDREDTYMFAWQGKSIAVAGGITKGDWGHPDKETEYVIIDSSEPIANQTNKKLLVNKYNVIIDIDGVSLYQLKS